MLTQKNIDVLMNEMQQTGSASVYYLAHNIELRESYIDELVYKSIAKFSILKLNITNIQNAYFEYLNFQNNPEAYHTEEETVYLDADAKYTYYYTVPNAASAYSKEFNARMPSAIYGKKRILFRRGVQAGDYNDPSPIQPIYTNSLSCEGCTFSELVEKRDNSQLDWKYLKLDEPVENDGVTYNYVTSDWYVFDTPNYPRVEKHMINVKQQTAFFISLERALSYKSQIEQ